jgi:hypothetical protein
MPVYWPGGARHRGGVNPACGFCAERGKAHADAAARQAAGEREGARPSGMTREALSTDAACAGGPARSSGEPAVTVGERRGRAIRGWFVWSTGDIREELHGRAEAGREAV